MRPLTFNIDFELAAMILLIVLFFYLKIHYYGRSKINDTMRRLVLTVVHLIFFDILTTITITYADVVPIWINNILNAVYYAFLGLTTYFMMLFIESFSVKERSFKKINIISQITFLIYAAIIIISIPTGIVFSFKGHVFSHGSLYAIVYLYPALLLVVSIVICFIIRPDLERLKSIYIIVLLLFSGLGAFLQFNFMPGYLLSNVTPALSLFIGLLLVVSPNYNELTNRKNDLEKAKSDLEKEVIARTKESREKEERSAKLVDEMIEALKTMIDKSNVNKANHTANVSKLSVLIAKELGIGYEERQKIYQMAVVHDIGIIGIDEEVALKNGVYTEEERREMERHPVIGEQILKAITELPDLAVAARSHHERYDGKGYPDHLKGNEIPLYARIVCVADAYDAMTEPRPYRQVYTEEDVRAEFERCSGKQFDPKIVRALFHVLDRGLYTPTGLEETEMGLGEEKVGL